MTKVLVSKLSTHNSFLVEEVLQILAECLDYNPYAAHNRHKTRYHFNRLKELLGQDFQLRYAECGCLGFAAIQQLVENLRGAGGLNTGYKIPKYLFILLNISEELMIHGQLMSDTVEELLALKDFTWLDAGYSLNTLLLQLIRKTCDEMRFQPQSSKAEVATPTS